jgi:hypothetical protein
MSKQPYDSSVKGILQEDAAEIVPQLLPGAVVLDTIDIEVLRPALRTDRVYRISYRSMAHLLHLEFQSSSDSKMAHRLLAYHAGLWLDHQLPIISLVVYLFPTTTPKPPLIEVSGKQEILIFQYQVIEMWTLDARYYVREHILCMYDFLPIMEHASLDVLIEVINDMIQYHQEDRESDIKFAHRLLWFRTFLERSTTIGPEDKKKVEERLNNFDHLLEENSFVRKQRALAWEEGKVVGEARGEARGEEKGQIEVSQQILLRILRDRYPALVPNLQPRIENTKQAEKLLEAIERIINIFDEQKTEDILNTFLA